MLDRAVSRRVFPGAVLRIRHGASQWTLMAGRTGYLPDNREVSPDTCYDLASLTKPLVTASVAAVLFQRGILDPFAPVASVVPEWKDSGGEPVCIHHLLQHTSGLPAWKPLYETLQPNGDIPAPVYKEEEWRNVRDSKLLPLLNSLERLAKPGEKAIYSDMGFLLLQIVLERLGDARLNALFDTHVKGHFNDLKLDYDSSRLLSSPAPTEFCPYRRRLLRGEVHDANAWALGGVASHAGLFGSAGHVMALLDEWAAATRSESEMLDRDTACRFLMPDDCPQGTSFVWGWDRPTFKTSAAGMHISPHSFGFLGFTGTSAWHDPDRDLSVVLLTNRVHPSSQALGIRRFRPALHTKIWEMLDAVEPGPWGVLPPKKAIRKVHFIGIAGTGMGSLAGLAKEAGFEVGGSDENVYPPMSDVLAEQGIEVKTPFHADNIDGESDLVVVGNVCTRNHVEALEVRRKRLAYDSFAGALSRLFLAERRPLVVAGTHGKTTTSSILHWLLHETGADPGYLIGGRVLPFNRGFRWGKGEYFVVEGDEYDSAYFDKAPKFLHYRPQHAIVTSCEFDHADIYDDADEIEARFRQFMALVPSGGTIAACWDWPRVRRAAAGAKARVVSYGLHPNAEWRPEALAFDEYGTRFRIFQKGKTRLEGRWPLAGMHNLLNLCGALILLDAVGTDFSVLGSALERFEGVDRRQQVLGVARGVRVIDDFAHHPTAIEVTLDALKRRYPEGRLAAVFDPRTNTTSRNVLQHELERCWKNADAVFVGPPSRPDRIAPEHRLDVPKVVANIRGEGKPAFAGESPDELLPQVLEFVQPGDTVAVLSNGGFGGFHRKLIDALENMENSP